MHACCVHVHAFRVAILQEALVERHFELWTVVPPELMAGRMYRKTISLDKNSINELAAHYNGGEEEDRRVSIAVYTRIVHAVMSAEGSHVLVGVEADHNFCSFCKNFKFEEMRLQTSIAGAPKGLS